MLGRTGGLEEWNAWEVCRVVLVGGDTTSERADYATIGDVFHMHMERSQVMDAGEMSILNMEVFYALETTASHTCKKRITQREHMSTAKMMDRRAHPGSTPR